MVTPALNPHSKDGSVERLSLTVKRRLHHGAKSYSRIGVLTLHTARMCLVRQDSCWCQPFAPGFSFEENGYYPTIWFGLGSMQKAVLGPAWVIRQLENTAHSYGRGLSLSTRWI
jgi:hypothetical protein